MAPPPPATLPLGQRLAALAQTLQFAWFTGHVTLLLSTVRYGLSYITWNTASRWAAFSYRTAFLSACVTYGIVVYKAHRARLRQGKQGGIFSLATDENVQYLGESAKPCFSAPSKPPNATQSWRLYGCSLARSRWLCFRLPFTQCSMSQPTYGLTCCPRSSPHLQGPRALNLVSPRRLASL